MAKINIFIEDLPHGIVRANVDPGTKAIEEKVRAGVATPAERYAARAFAEMKKEAVRQAGMTAPGKILIGDKH